MGSDSRLFLGAASQGEYRELILQELNEMPPDEAGGPRQ
jgi:hypothetical protein